ncbi:MAG: SDR family oxidoreductase [Halieaceae bacterium]
MHASLDFSGKVVVVSGGDSSLGAQIAEHFLAAGAEVAVTVSNASTMPPEGTEAYSCDALDYEQMSVVFEQIRESRGRIDTLVIAGNNATAEASEDVIRQQLVAPLNASQLANRVMQEQDTGGAIIYLTGSPTQPGDAFVPASCAASAGIRNLVTSLAVEWAPRVRVNAVESAAHSAATADICNACLFLASGLSDYVSGSCVSPGHTGKR